MARRRAAAASPAVVGAISTMALVYYSTVFVFLDHCLGLGTTSGATNAAAVSLAVAACSLAFVCAAAADPGAVPTTFCPDAEAAQGQDHHCIWINNCVGYANYKAFIICVLNATIGSLYSFVLFLCYLLLAEHEFDIVYVKIVYILAGVLLFFLSLTIGSLLCWHIYLLCHNMTTIEFREAVKAKCSQKRVARSITTGLTLSN